MTEPEAHAERRDSGRKLRIGVVACEASGDNLGGGLIAALRERAPEAEFFGIAGPSMIAAGCEPWYRTEEISVMGLAEVLKHLPRLIRLRRGLIRRLVEAGPDIFIGIDSPDFNLPVAAALKRAGVPTVQYVSPQIWAWRQSRVTGIRKSVDQVLCVLPFEPQFYDEHGVSARFVGHPLADDIPLEVQSTEARAALGLEGPGPFLSILPGSRNAEVSRLAAPFLDTAKWLRARHPGLQVLVGLANDATGSVFAETLAGVALDPPPVVFTGRTREVIAAADVVLTASGTAALEVALIKRPMVVAYIVSGVTLRLFKLLGFNRLEHFSLPNLLAERRLVPEYLQRDVCAAVLGPALESYLRGGDREGRSDWYDAFASIHQQLRHDASAGAASAVLDLLNNETDSP